MTMISVRGIRPDQRNADVRGLKRTSGHYFHPTVSSLVPPKPDGVRARSATPPWISCGFLFFLHLVDTGRKDIAASIDPSASFDHSTSQNITQRGMENQPPHHHLPDPRGCPIFAWPPSAIRDSWHMAVHVSAPHKDYLTDRTPAH